MSNQFSYELDERQIRIMLRDGEVENDPSAWNRFEQLAQPDVKPRQASFSPRFNISISRSVMVPAVFVLLIGGLSATLFSFVDFKKKDVATVKHTLEDKAVNTTPTQQPVSKPETKPATEEKSLTTVATPSVAAPTPSLQQAAIAQTDRKPVVQKTETKPVAVPVKTITTPAVTASNATPVQPLIKKRKKNAVSEEIPTINTSSTTLNQESQEPELELR
eukprot:TRINITY_DN22717_c0_g1_i1.p1 TRINITY_DN22717_c0_g1~~TRINITY_DN22717_c0_g1_i1.p1  ORF type:complete len:219 (+),score=39.52 TRINITY_DN22717_c0_g1_i1:574-1230(+)